MPPVPSDLPSAFMDMVLYGSGPGDDRVILLGCAELLDGLAWADLWLADGTFKVVRRTGTEVLNQRQLVHYIFFYFIHMLD